MEKNNSPLKIIEENISKGDFCLDLGCGKAPLGRFLLEKGLKVYFLDKDKEKLDYLKDNLKEFNFNLINKDILKYKSKEKFKIILLKGVINFLKERDLDIIFEIFKNNLNKEGIVYITWINDFPTNKKIISLVQLKDRLIEENFKCIYLNSFEKTDEDNHKHHISSIIAKKYD